MNTTLPGRLCVLLAATALAAQPVMAQELIRTRPAAPAATLATPQPAPAAVVAPMAASAAQPSPVSNTPASGADELPQGAPADDYEFLGWCTGILTGHMQLYFRVKPELDAIGKRWNTVESDARQQAEQQAAGKELLAQFRHAMGTVEAASPSPISFRGQTAVQKGLATWSNVEKQDKQNQAYSWMNFGLPGRCENKAAELEKSGGKIKAVAMTTPAAAPAGVTVRTSATAVTPTPSTVPKPATTTAPKPNTPAAKRAEKAAPTAKNMGLRR
jgi:hypothetical protein